MFTNDVAAIGAFQGLVIDQGGAVAFKVRLVGGNATVAKDSAFVTISPSGQISMPLREGEASPNGFAFPDVRDYSGPYFRNGAIAAGQWVIAGGVVGYTLDPADPANGVQLATSLGINSAGQILVYFDSFSSKVGFGFWNGGSLATIVSKLDTIPTTDRKYYSFRLGEAFNSRGELAFVASDSNPNRYILTGTPGAFNVLLRTGDIIPGGTTEQFFSGSDTQINDAGDVAFLGYSNIPHREGLFFKSHNGGLRAVALVGKPAVAAGFPANAVFTDIIDADNIGSTFDYGLGPEGQVVFQATVQGTGLSGKALTLPRKNPCPA